MSKVFVGLLIVAFLALSVMPVGAITRDEARAELAKAFVGVQRAERAYGYVAGLVEKLNTATRLLDVGGDDNVAQAAALISNVLALTPSVESLGNQAELTRLVLTGVSLVILGAAALLVWRYGSRVYWGLWLRVRGGWRVERA